MLRPAAAALALLLLLPATPALPAAGHGAQAAAPAVSHHNVTAAAGTVIAITVFQPANASASDPVPVILRSHGFSGSRDTEAKGRVADLLDAGYGVVSFDARGHGQSGGVAMLHHWDHEIADIPFLLDWMHDHLPWVEKEASGIPKDIRVGGSGGSYGGAWQLLGAAKDPRIDAIVPEITWNNLAESLAPNGAVRSAWVNFFYAAGMARARLAPEITQWYLEVMATNQAPPAVVENLTMSSPSRVMGLIQVPTLLVQGNTDTLFNLNEARRNMEGIAANGAPVKLFTYRGGHILNLKALESQAPPVGLQPFVTESPCGNISARAIQWYDRWLRDLPVGTGDAVELALDDGGCLHGPSLAALAAPATRSWGTLAVEGSALVPLDVAAGAAVAGIPTLSFAFLNTCEPWTVYASLVALGPDGLRPLDEQAMPLRRPLSLVCPLAMTLGAGSELAGVGARLQPGEALYLRLDTFHEQFYGNAERWPQKVVLTGLNVGLPLA